MNALVKTANAISTCRAEEVAPQIMAFCRAVTPQFYKNMADVDLIAEKSSIELLTSNIEQECLAEMCKLAVLNYPRARSENAKEYFDINYILTFYKYAFNKVFCSSVEMPKNSNLIDSRFDPDTNILTETYEAPDGRKIIIREIIDASKFKNTSRFYSSKYFETLITDLSDVEI